MSGESKLAIGLMSGTSLDGVDVALIRTNGTVVEEVLGFETYPYPDDFRQKVQGSFGQKSDFGDLEKDITYYHAQAVERFLQTAPANRSEIDVIGFHGQTMFHDPDDKVTVQLGDGADLAKALGISVVNDFRTEDVKLGGQGAPLVPIYHQALTYDMQKPIAVLNLGGVGNVTWIGMDGSLLAFDTGPANALIDDWVKRHDKGNYDPDGVYAKEGYIDDDAVNRFIRHPYFEQKVPKSLDRDEFKSFAFELVEDMAFEDGCATLTAFSVAAVMRAQDFLPELAEMWVVCGGGRLNTSMMSALKAYLYGAVLTAEDVGWNGDATEAEAFAFMAVRKLYGMPITFPQTTGVASPSEGGVVHQVGE